MTPLFAGRKKTNPIIPIKTDIHSHVLPGIDDGSPDINTSIEMLKAFEKSGFYKIITTPHINIERYKNNTESTLNAFEELKDAAQENKINIIIEVAAEYFADNHFLELIKNKEVLSFGNKYVLLEFDFLRSPVNPEIFSAKLMSEGYNPVLAHPERYEYWENNLTAFSFLKDAGFLFQSHISSAAGLYGGHAKRTFKLLAKNNMIDFLGTDAHNAETVYKSALKIESSLIQEVILKGIRNIEL